jgi:hypothetical protein
MTTLSPTGKCTSLASIIWPSPKKSTGAVSGLTKKILDPDKLQIFPNPAQTTVTIKAEAGSQIGIYSMEGVLLLEQAVRSENTIINITSLPAGVYVARSGERGTRFVVKDN